MIKRFILALVLGCSCVFCFGQDAPKSDSQPQAQEEMQKAPEGQDYEKPGLTPHQMALLESWRVFFEEHVENCQACKQAASGKPGSRVCEVCLSKYLLLLASRETEIAEADLIPNSKITEVTISDNLEDKVIVFKTGGYEYKTTATTVYAVLMTNNTRPDIMPIELEQARSGLLQYKDKDWLDCVNIYTGPDGSVVAVFIKVS